MPHINIKCYPGKTEEQKRLLAEKVTEDIIEIFNTRAEAVSVTIQEVPQEEWSTVYKTEIAANKANLYKEPGYTCE